MKRLSFLMASLLACSLLFVGCSKEFDEPTIEVTLNGEVTTQITVDWNKGVSVIIDFVADADIKQIDIDEVGGGNLTGYPKTRDFKTNTTDQAVFTIPARSANPEKDVEVKYNVKITDREDQSQNRQIVVTFKGEKGPEYGDIIKHSSVKLGSFTESTYGSSFASITGQVWKLAEAKENSSHVDFIYSDGSSFEKTLVAPSVDNAITNLYSGAVKTWSKRNATKFAKLSGITAAEFSACENDGLIVEHVTTTSVTANIVSDLNTGDIVGFITDGGKKGLLKIDTIVQTANDKHIIFTVLVQE